MMIRARGNMRLGAVAIGDDRLEVNRSAAETAGQTLSGMARCRIIRRPMWNPPLRVCTSSHSAAETQALDLGLA